jgi:hypothetical protein
VPQFSHLYNGNQSTLTSLHCHQQSPPRTQPYVRPIMVFQSRQPWEVDIFTPTFHKRKQTQCPRSPRGPVGLQMSSVTEEPTWISKSQPCTPHSSPLHSVLLLPGMQTPLASHKRSVVCGLSENDSPGGMIAFSGLGKTS